jgi:uncharacterized membrane protein YfcA
MDSLLQEIGIIWLLALMLTAFAAGYIDAVAGGGGMLQLPALLFVGIAPVSALATNKIIGFTGTFVAVIKYAVEKKINWKIVLYAAILCLIASYLGSQLAMKLNTRVLEWMILLCIPIALFFIFRANNKEQNIPVDSPAKTIIGILNQRFLMCIFLFGYVGSSLVTSTANGKFTQYLRSKFPIAALKNLALALLGLQFFALLLEIDPHKFLDELTICCTS